MQYGVYLPNFGPFGQVNMLASLAQEAEHAGWHGFFIWDHINRPAAMGPVADPWVALAAITARTANIRIGALVTPLPRRRPWKLARETVSIDHLSNGRLIFSAGIGSGRVIEWGDLGEENDAKVRAAMLDEGLEILSGLWSGSPFSFSGQHYQVKDVQFLPKTKQQPRIPVWIGGYWPHLAPLKRAARWDGAFTLFDEKHAPVMQQLTEMTIILRQHRTDLNGFDIVFRNDWWKGSQAIESALQAEEIGVTWWLEHIVPTAFGGKFENDWPVDAMRRFILQGPPQKP